MGETEHDVLDAGAAAGRPRRAQPHVLLLPREGLADGSPARHAARPVAAGAARALPDRLPRRARRAHEVRRRGPRRRLRHCRGRARRGDRRRHRVPDLRLPGKFAEDISACDRPYGDSPPSNIASYPFAPEQRRHAQDPPPAAASSSARTWRPRDGMPKPFPRHRHRHPRGPPADRLRPGADRRAQGRARSPTRSASCAFRRRRWSAATRRCRARCASIIAGANGIGLARRITGGGAIYFDEGQLGWELVFAPLDARHRIARRPRARDLRGRRGGLSTLGVDARYRPRNDIEVDGRKMSAAPAASSTATRCSTRARCWSTWIRRGCSPPCNVPQAKLARRGARFGGAARGDAARSCSARAPADRATCRRRCSRDSPSGSASRPAPGRIDAAERKRSPRGCHDEEIGTDAFVAEIDDPARRATTFARQRTRAPAAPSPPMCASRGRGGPHPRGADHRRFLRHAAAHHPRSRGGAARGGGGRGARRRRALLRTCARGAAERDARRFRLRARSGDRPAGRRRPPGLTGDLRQTGRGRLPLA